MRRIAAAVLLLFVGALLPAATVAAMAAPQALLPVCCRTHGAHACGMGSGSVAIHSSGPTLRAAGCPYGQALRAITTVTISADFARNFGLGLAVLGFSFALMADMVAIRFRRRFVPRGPPSFLFSL